MGDIFTEEAPSRAALDTATKITSGSLLTDVGVLKKAPGFMWLVVAAASYSATLACFSSFGATFLRDLGFVSSEPLGSFCLGSVVATAAVIGTLVGGTSLTPPAPSCGAHLDRIVEQHPDTFRTRYCPSSALNGAYHSLQIEETSSDADPCSLCSPQSGAETFYFFPKLLTKFFWIIFCCIALLAVASITANTLGSFLLYSGLALTGLFACQVGLNMATMLVVPEPQRCAAVATTTFFLHVFGDVPSPILIGFLKDVLAPACAELPVVTNRDHVMPFQTLSSESLFQKRSDACLAQSGGIRLTLLIATAWLFWMLLGISRTRHVLLRRNSVTRR